MLPNWTTSVDMLADAGIIDYDASAYILGAPARFVGRPQYSIYNIPPLAIQPPRQDEYRSTLPDKSIVKNPLWKKVLFGALATGGVLFGIAKLRMTPQFFKNIGVKISDFFKKIFKKSP